MQLTASGVSGSQRQLKAPRPFILRRARSNLEPCSRLRACARPRSDAAVRRCGGPVDRLEDLQVVLAGLLGTAPDYQPGKSVVLPARARLSRLDRSHASRSTSAYGRQASPSVVPISCNEAGPAAFRLQIRLHNRALICGSLLLSRPPCSCPTPGRQLANGRCVQDREAGPGQRRTSGRESP